MVTGKRAAPEYWETVAFVDGEEYKIGFIYGVELRLNRVSGWFLVKTRGDGSEEMVAGEFTGHDFRVEVRGTVICKSNCEYKTDGSRNDAYEADGARPRA